MGNRLYLHFFKQCQHRLYINLCGCKQCFTDGFAAQSFQRCFDIRIFYIQHTTHQREAVGMYTAGGQSQNHIALFDGFVVQDFILIDNAYGEACQIVFILGIEAGHFCRFAANQCRTGLHTAFCHAANDGGNLFREVLADCDIVQEEQGLCTNTNDIVYAHSHAVNPYGIMLIHQKCQFQLCANAVCTADQYGFCDARHIQFKHAIAAPIFPVPTIPAVFL